MTKKPAHAAEEAEEVNLEYPGDRVEVVVGKEIHAVAAEAGNWAENHEQEEKVNEGVY